MASERSQLFVTTHSPFFVDALTAKELRVVYRDTDGYTRVRRASDMPGIPTFIDHGSTLGHLWMSGHFDVGDPFQGTGTQTPQRGGRARNTNERAR